jgi:serine/threonine-protein kinase
MLAAGSLVPASWTPDGRQLLAVRAGPPEDIVRVIVEEGKTTVQPLSQSLANARWPEVSPDGRWLAYASDVSGRTEVYVRPYPGPGPTEPVSIEGGHSPAWHPSGRELFFTTLPPPAGQARMMVVDFAPGSPPRLVRPRLLFVFDPRELNLRCGPVRCYDVAPDGQRFYTVQKHALPPPPAVTHINLIQNWLEELKAKVPTR